MRQPRPTEVRLIETGGPDHVSDYSESYHSRSGNKLRAGKVLKWILAQAVRAGYGKVEKPVLECDCWMITYGSGDYEIVTIGDALAGTCRYPGKPVSYVAPMKLVWH